MSVITATLWAFHKLILPDIKSKPLVFIYGVELIIYQRAKRFGAEFRFPITTSKG